MCLTLSRCPLNISVLPEDALLMIKVPEGGKGTCHSCPGSVGKHRAWNRGSRQSFWSRASCISYGLSRLFFLWPAPRRRVHGTNTAPELHPARQFHSVLSSAISRTPCPSPDTASHLCRGSRVVGGGVHQGHGIAPSLAANAVWGFLAARMVVNICSSHVRVKDYVFATKGRI